MIAVGLQFLDTCVGSHSGPWLGWSDRMLCRSGSSGIEAVLLSEQRVQYYQQEACLWSGLFSSWSLLSDGLIWKSLPSDMLLPWRCAWIAWQRKFQRASGQVRNITWLHFWHQILKMYLLVWLYSPMRDLQWQVKTESSISRMCIWWRGLFPFPAFLFSGFFEGDVSPS